MRKIIPAVPATQSSLPPQAPLQEPPHYMEYCLGCGYMEDCQSMLFSPTHNAFVCVACADVVRSAD